MNSPKHEERGKESVTLGFLDSMVSLNKSRVFLRGKPRGHPDLYRMSMDVHGCPTQMCIMVYLYYLNQKCYNPARSNDLLAQKGKGINPQEGQHLNRPYQRHPTTNMVE